MTDQLPAIFAGMSEKQVAFVQHFVETGGKQSLASEMAGFSTKANGHRVTAHRLLRDPRILRAIKHEVDTRIRAGAVVAMTSLLDLAEKAVSETVRYQAAQAVLDRAGLLVTKTSELNITVDDNRSTKELVAFIREAARRNGFDPDALLSPIARIKSNAGLVLDAEFEEVPPDGREGLEDVL